MKRIGGQHIVLAPIDDAWIDGGTPIRSSVRPWSGESIERSDIDYRQRTIDPSLVEEAVSELVTLVRFR